MDSSEEVTEIFPFVVPLNSTAAKMKGCQVIYKQRVGRYLLYNRDVYNEFGNFNDIDIHGDNYFQDYITKKGFPID